MNLYIKLCDKIKVTLQKFCNMIQMECHEFIGNDKGEENLCSMRYTSKIAFINTQNESNLQNKVICFINGNQLKSFIKPDNLPAKKKIHTETLSI